MSLIDPKDYLEIQFSREDMVDSNYVNQIAQFSKVKFLNFKDDNARIVFGYVSGKKAESCICDYPNDVKIQMVINDTIEYLRDTLKDFEVYYTLTHNGQTYSGRTILFKNLTTLAGIGVIRELSGETITGSNGVGKIKFEYVNDVN